MKQGVFAAVALSMVLSSCVASLDVDPPLPTVTVATPSSPTPKEPEVDVGGKENRFEAAINLDVPGPLAYGVLINETLNDLELYWASTFPAVYGSDYFPIAEFLPYSVADGQLPTCGTDDLDSETAAFNAFYCPPDDTISWDNDQLFPQLYDEYGDFAVALVLAHEWGHAVQHRGGVRGPTILTELQADCFAGAWVGSLEERSSDLAPFLEDLDIATSGFLLFRDPVGFSANSAGAHGNAFDRLGHFGDGLRQGPSFCAELEQLGVEITKAGFTSAAEQQSGGNLPGEDVIPILSSLLDNYWGTLGSQLGFDWQPFEEVEFVMSVLEVDCDHRRDTIGGAWCPTANSAHLEVEEILQPLFNQFGDFGPGMILAQTWAQKGLEELGLETTGPGAVLRADCFVGDWASQMVEGIAQTPGGDDLISLSPGDLDEAIQSLLFIGGQEGLSSFERVESMRTGFFGGINACFGG